jgi:DNA-binding beta-propeller fold protein YncE
MTGRLASVLRPVPIALLCAVAIVGFMASGAASASAAPFAYDAAASEELSNTVPGGAFGEPFGLTFDSAGNLYVTDTSGNAGTGVVDKFNPDNVFQADLGATSFTNAPRLRGIAVNDESGHLYVGDLERASEPLTGSLYALDGTGAVLSQWLGAETSAGAFGEHFLSVAVDNSTSGSHGDVYVAVPTAQGGGEVDVFEPKNGDLEEGEAHRQLQSPEGFLFEGTPGVAVDSATGQVYVVDLGHKVVDRFGPTGAYETQITGSAAGEAFKEPTAVAVDSANGDVFVIDHVAHVIDRFDGAGELLAQISETEPNEPLGNPVDLAVQETGPHAGALYVVDGGAKKVDVFAELPPAAPQIESEGVSVVGSTATLLGEIDPRGAPTEYRFEYGACATPTTCAATPFEHVAPVPDAALGFEDFNAHAVAPVEFGGLIAGTIYHFRLVAHNALGAIIGEERTFLDPAGNPFALPDQRQWQLVSPGGKSGQISTLSELGVIQASLDGGAVTYLTNASTEPFPAGAPSEVQVLSNRTSSGWSSRDIASPHQTVTGNSPGTAPEYRFFSQDLSMSVVQPFGLFNPELSAEASEQTPYLRTLDGCASSCYQPLVTASNANGAHFGAESVCKVDNSLTPLAGSVCGPRFEAATPNASHVILRSAEPLTPGAPTGEVKPGGAGITGGLYEWGGGTLQLIAVLPPDASGEEIPVSAASEPRLGGGLGGRSDSDARHAVSDDGSRIFWVSLQGLFMRDTTAGRTVQLDAAEPQCLAAGACEGGGGRFQIASADGSRVFFTDSHRLTEDSEAVDAGNIQKPDLYECHIVEVAGEPGCDLTDLTPDEGGEPADVQGVVLGASESGSVVYFVADGTLSGVAHARGTCSNVPEPQPAGAQCNLFEYRRGQLPRLVAVLSGADVKAWTGGPYRLSRVSPDGNWLSFLSQRPLTGYDNRDAVSGNPDAEAYLFDAASGELYCASCNPSGARPAGVEYGKIVSGTSTVLPGEREEAESQDWVSTLLPRTTAFAEFSPGYQPNYLNDSGRLYFNSLDALVPSDTNATGDVYQYESPGVGSCTTASSTYSTQDGGCVDLISSGTSPQRSTFLDASESGDDVFFLTSSRLSPQDVDNAQDVYDAHSCEEASGCLTEPAPPAAPCTGEACQSEPPAPAEARPQSQSFSGPGNPVTCRKGQVKKGGKCVKQKKKKNKKKKHGKKSKTAGKKSGSGKKSQNYAKRRDTGNKHGGGR